MLYIQILHFTFSASVGGYGKTNPHATGASDATTATSTGEAATTAVGLADASAGLATGAAFVAANTCPSSISAKMSTSASTSLALATVADGARTAGMISYDFSCRLTLALVGSELTLALVGSEGLGPLLPASGERERVRSPSRTRGALVLTLALTLDGDESLGIESLLVLMGATLTRLSQALACFKPPPLPFPPLEGKSKRPRAPELLLLLLLSFGCTLVAVVSHEAAQVVFVTIPRSISTSLLHDERGRAAAAGLFCCGSKGGVDLTVDAGDHWSANDRELKSHADSWGGTRPFFRGAAGGAGRFVSPLCGRGNASARANGEHANVSKSSPIDDWMGQRPNLPEATGHVHTVRQRTKDRGGDKRV